MNIRLLAIICLGLVGASAQGMYRKASFRLFQPRHFSSFNDSVRARVANPYAAYHAYKQRFKIEPSGTPAGKVMFELLKNQQMVHNLSQRQAQARKVSLGQGIKPGDMYYDFNHRALMLRKKPTSIYDNDLKRLRAEETQLQKDLAPLLPIPQF